MDKLQDIDLNLVVTLDALLEEQSVSKAAARLGLSTPAVSHALSRLRTTLNDPVLVRAGRTMVPSPRALQLRARVRSIVIEIEAVFQPGEAFVAARSSRRFRLLASDYVIGVLGRVLDELVTRQAPGVVLEFMPNTTADPDAIRDGTADLAIGVYDRLHPEIRIQKLFAEELVAMVREGHPTVHKRMSLQQYVGLSHIQVAPRGRPGGVIDDTLAKHGLRRSVVRRVPYFVSALVLVATSDHVVTLPRRLAMTHAERFHLRVLGLPISVSPYAVSQIWHPRHQGDEGLQWLRSCVVEASGATKPKRR